MTRPIRVFPAPGCLAALVERPGGLPRSLAIMEGQRRLDMQRPPALAVIGKLIGALEEIAASPPAPARLPEMRRIADQLIALAGLYGLDALAGAGRRLCDLALGLEGQGAVHGAAITVHVRALRLLSTDSSAAHQVLGELDRVHGHVRRS